MAGMKDKVVGKAKEVEGKLTGDELREAEGKAQGAKGDLTDAAHDIKNRIKNAARDTKDRVD
jgi:uncharacterized protein YjbJ (UPF0337 family)